MKKLFKLLLGLVACASLVSCGVNPQNKPEDPVGPGDEPTCEGSSCATGEIDLDAINAYIKGDPYWADMNSMGNPVTLIPFVHINGPRVEWNFFAIVNFEYDAMTYFKYEVTYLSCTCRAAEVNYWQTAYVELSVPGSGQADDVKLRKISFEKDNTGLYLAGFWGDSGIKELEPEGINNTGIFYEDIRDKFVPYLVGKTYKDFKQWNVVEDIKTTGDFETKMAGTTFQNPIKGEAEHQVTIDDFEGASVSTNNIIRMVTALMKYHAENHI